MSSLTVTTAYTGSNNNSPSSSSSGYNGSLCTSSSFSGNSSESSSATSSLASTSRVHQSKSPHGILPLRQLVPIKIMDRQSCFVNGIDLSIAKDEILRSSQYFGQFGTIISIRFILNSNPAQALLRFATEEGAALANAWCNQQTSAECPISAKHGYQKYCISFIKNKQCAKPGCPHRHRWCGPDDIITVKNQTFKVSETPSDIFLRSKKKKNKSNKLHHPSPTSAMATPPKNIFPTPPHAQADTMPTAVPPQAEHLMIVQQQFSILQLQHTQQTESVKMLLVQMKALQAENRMLQSIRTENRMLRHQLGQTAHYRPNQFYPTTNGQQAMPPQRVQSQPQPPQMTGVTPYYPTTTTTTATAAKVMSAYPYHQHPQQLQSQQQQQSATSSTDEEMVSDIIDSLFQSDEFIVSESTLHRGREQY